MWFLILAILFWGYLIVKLGLERAGIKRHEREYNKANKEAGEFFKKYSISSYEWGKLKHWSEITNQDTKQEYYADIEAMQSELTATIGINPSYDMIYWGILAKQGKIPPELEFPVGYDTPLSFKSVHDFDCYFYDYTPNERNWFFLKFLKWYDKTIREHGMEYKLVYARQVPKNSGYGSSLSEKIGDIERFSSEEDPFLIVAYWEPLRSKAETVCY